MSDPRELPNPDELTRQPGRVSVGGDEQISPEEALEQAKAQLANERAATQAAEQRARDEAQRRAAAESQALNAHGTAVSAHAQSLHSAIAAQQALAQQAEDAYASAFAAGDPGGVAKAQRQMSDAAARLAILDGQKRQFEQAVAEQQAQAQRQPPPQQQMRTGVRVVTPGGELEVQPSDKEWMDKHSRFYSDPDYYNHALTAHSRIERDGVVPGSPAYYRELDTAMQNYERFEAHERGDAPVNDGLSQRQQMRRQPASSMAAPVSRASAPRQPSNGVMSVSQVAQYIGPGVTEADLREYARINGYGKDEAGFQRYLADQSQIISLDRAGGDTGLRSDAMYR